MPLRPRKNVHFLSSFLLDQTQTCQRRDIHCRNIIPLKKNVGLMIVAWRGVGRVTLTGLNTLFLGGAHGVVVSTSG